MRYHGINQENKGFSLNVGTSTKNLNKMIYSFERSFNEDYEYATIRKCVFFQKNTGIYP